MDLDTTRSKEGHEKILSAFANEEADILVGTQMIVKGHDFPNVTWLACLLRICPYTRMIFGQQRGHSSF